MRRLFYENIKWTIFPTPVVVVVVVVLLLLLVVVVVVVVEVEYFISNFKAYENTKCTYNKYNNGNWVTSIATAWIRYVSFDRLNY